MADTAGENWSDLLGALKTAVWRVILALRAFGSAPQAKARKPKPAAFRFGEYEKIEEAKYSPAPPPTLADDADLPQSYGEPRVTLLAVNPYLVHVYWDFDPANLPPRTTSAVLRFYDVADSRAPSRFDVDIDLRARNWYVHLLSPAKSYYVDLGVKTVGDRFIPLVRSNTVQTPRAWPVAEVVHHFTPGGAGSPRQAASAPRPVEPGPQMPVLAGTSVPSQHSESLETAKPSARPVEPVGPQVPVLGGTPVSSRYSESLERARPSAEAEPVVSVAEPPPALRVHAPRGHSPVDAAAILQEVLSEIYAFQQWRPQPAKAPAASVSGSRLSAIVEHYLMRSGPAASDSGSRLPANPGAQGDLTTLTEQQFSLGLSSALLGSRGPERPAG